MRISPFGSRVVGCVNAVVGALATSPRSARVVGRTITVISYTGRRSGRTFRTPVAYRRSGDEVVIGIQFAEAKNWWRNFLGAGGPIAMELDGVARTGHAVATHDGDGRATVRVRLDPT